MENYPLKLKRKLSLIKLKLTEAQISDCSLMKIPLTHKHRKRTRNLQKHEMSFTNEAFVCLGKQTAFNFPLEWSYSQAGKRELRAIFKKKFLKHFKKITVIY